MRRMFTCLVATVLVTATVSCQSRPASPPSVRGVWRVVEVETTGPGASTNSKPQPGLYIFTAKYYSIARVMADKPRPNQPQDVTKATAAELLAAWNLFIAQSGTYEIAGSNLTLRPEVAKNPTVMAAGSYTTNSYKLEGNTLSLTPKTTNTGPVAMSGTIKLIRVE